MRLAVDQRDVLQMLANAADGCTVPALLDYGYTVTTLRRLVRSQLAVAERVHIPGVRRSLTAVRLRISDAGRRALAG
jgi:hypothetical protein